MKASNLGLSAAKSITLAGQWWYMPLIPGLRRQRQVDLCESEASLVYRGSSRTARATQGNPVSKTKQNKTKQRITVFATNSRELWLGSKTYRS